MPLDTERPEPTEEASALLIGAFDGGPRREWSGLVDFITSMIIKVHLFKLTAGKIWYLFPSPNAPIGLLGMRIDVREYFHS